ncbi:recombinase family protein [Streptomyces sp. NPDC001714]|uniref:recombinase family protein n=1 Tax=Streptomyces sp. NPDC001714 TaxID=3364603 RepID=UPI00368B6ABC
MSKGERNRIKIRVRAAMASQAKIEGRYLGGRPPYGYRLADAGPHPHPAKASDGKRLHRLEPDPATAPIVQRIFHDYCRGRGFFAIAESLTRDGIPSPSAHDPARNQHRSGIAWSKGAVRAILSNSRYTGRQVWNKQRKEETLLDVDNVALGHETRLRWNQPDAWIWSNDRVHPPLIDTETFELAQALRAAKGADHTTRERRRHTSPRYVLRTFLHCGLCGRRMQAHCSHDVLYYRCRFPSEYGLANKVSHPRNVYVAERDLIAPLDTGSRVPSPRTGWRTRSRGCTRPSSPTLRSRRRRRRQLKSSPSATRRSPATERLLKPAQTRHSSADGSPKPRPAAPERWPRAEQPPMRTGSPRRTSAR